MKGTEPENTIVQNLNFNRYSSVHGHLNAPSQRSVHQTVQLTIEASNLLQHLISQRLPQEIFLLENPLSLLVMGAIRSLLETFLRIDTEICLSNPIVPNSRKYDAYMK